MKVMNTEKPMSLSRQINGICQCGAPLHTEVYLYLNADDTNDLSLLSQGLHSMTSATCDACGRTAPVIEPFALDLPRDSSLCIVVPDALGYRAFSCMAEVMSGLAASSLQFKPYFSFAELIVGEVALQHRLARVTPPYHISVSGSTAHPVSLPPPLQSAEDDPSVSSTTLTPISLTPKSHLARAPLNSPLPQHITEVSSDSATINMTLAQEIAQAQTKVSRIGGVRSDLSSERSESSSGLDALIDSALGEGDVQLMAQEELQGHDEFSQFHRAHTAVTDLHQASASEITHNFTPRSTPQEPQIKAASASNQIYAHAVRQFDQDLARGSSRYFVLKEDRVEVAAKLDERHAEQWITGELDIRLQLHLIDDRGAPCLTLFTLEDGVVQDELYWPIHVDDQLGPKVLRALRKSFRLELTLFKKNNNFYGQRMIEAPLEENAAYLINHIKKMRMTHSAAARVRALITAEDYDRDGQMKHPFHSESFSEIKSAKDALLAVGIWSYWSTVKQRDYLIFNKSFPIPWLRRLQHRVLKSALEFGVAMPKNLQSQAIALGLAKSDVELLQKNIAHFVEVNVQLRASEMTHEELWENWDALLSQLDELGIDADEEVEQLAFQALQRVGLDHEFDEITPTDAVTILPSQPSADLAFDDSPDDDVSEIRDIDVAELIDEELEESSRSDGANEVPVNEPLESDADAPEASKDMSNQDSDHSQSDSVDDSLSSVSDGPTDTSKDESTEQLGEHTQDRDEESQELDEELNQEPRATSTGAPREHVESVEYEQLEEGTEGTIASQGLSPETSADEQSERESSVTAGDFELISEEFIEEEYLTDGGEMFLVIDDTDIVEEDIVDPQTAELGDQVLEEEEQMRTELLVSVSISDSEEGAEPLANAPQDG